MMFWVLFCGRMLDCNFRSCRLISDPKNQRLVKLQLGGLSWNREKFPMECFLGSLQTNHDFLMESHGFWGSPDGIPSPFSELLVGGLWMGSVFFGGERIPTGSIGGLVSLNYLTDAIKIHHFFQLHFRPIICSESIMAYLAIHEWVKFMVIL